MADFIHKDTGGRCMVYHGDDESKGESCWRCTCHKWVRPHQWEAHCRGEVEGQDLPIVVFPSERPDPDEEKDE